MAFTAVIGLAAGTSAVTAVTVLAAVAEIGMAMTVVGAVTGSKQLMKIGGAMSLVGGVGGALAGAASGAAGAAGSAAASEAALTGEAAFSGYAAEAGSAAAAESAITSGLSAGADAGMQLTNSMDMKGNLAVPDAPSSFDPMTTSAPATPASSSTMPVGATQQAPAVVGAQDVAGATAPAEAYNPLAGDISSSTAPQSTKSFFDSFSNFANKNKGLMDNGMKLVGSTLKGMGEASQAEDRLALEQQRLKQTSYASATANFAPRGILSGAQQ